MNNKRVRNIKVPPDENHPWGGWYMFRIMPDGTEIGISRRRGYAMNDMDWAWELRKARMELKRAVENYKANQAGN